MEFDLPKETSSIIKVIGVGGGGSNAVNHMYGQGIIGVDFIVCNTDRQALDISPVPYKIQLGPSLTEGRGAGAMPEIGMNAAIENIEEIRELLSKNTKMVFVTAGLGGGTGTGAAPVIAQVAKDMGILTVGIVTVPFNFEGRRRRQQAEEGMSKMRENVDTLLVINNERLREITGNLTIGNAFSQADNVLTTAAKGIAEVIAVTGAINVDFNDVRTVMKDSGVAIMGSAAAEGENRAVTAVSEALNSPLLNDNDIRGARHVLLNITYGDKEVLMDEITEITDYIQDEAGSTADVIWGHGYDATLGDKLSVTIIATGFQSNPITGFEKPEEKKVTPLEEEPRKEIVTPLNAPTQTKRVTLDLKEEQTPFLKTEEPVNHVVEAPQPIVDRPASTLNLYEQEEKPVQSTKVEATNQINWDIQPSVTPTPRVEERPITRTEPTTSRQVFNLEDDLASKVNQNNVNERETLSPEEHQRRAQERMNKIVEYTSKLKKAEGIIEFENEPAYMRRNIQLDNSKPSTEDNLGRYGVAQNGTGSSLRNNNFLHDNVD
jgi:cell division protein FtsZ